MKCCSKKIPLSAPGKKADRDSVQRTEKLNAKRYTLYAKGAFSLVEVVAALVILAFVSSSVLVVFNRYMASAADSMLRMQAFEVARANMEELLTLDSVAESVEYGYSERYPDIEWQTAVETFYEPLTSRMWIQAICSTEYTDSENEVQTVELTHWLTDVTKSQLLQILEQQQDEIEQLAGQVIETLEEAAEYAGVDQQTIQQWIENGMLLTEEGSFPKGQLSLYMNSNGMPTAEDRVLQAKADAEIVKKAKEQAAQDKPSEQDKPRQTDKPREELIQGYTMKELEAMSLEELIKILFGNQ
ncbi:MAG TPA: type II secretion system protein [Planctomycetes bacterium]|nr:type II secretion system protein [Planctomycetota bacterium]